MQKTNKKRENRKRRKRKKKVEVAWLLSTRARNE
jgi:hypothetical protein